MNADQPLDSAVLVINPTRYPGYVRTLKRLAGRRRVPQVIETQNREHFAQSVLDFCGGPYRYLLVWGGDGTAHLAINAMMKAGCPHTKAIGFLRGGTGNGIQDSYNVPFGLSRQLRTYARSIARRLTIDVDLLHVRTSTGERYGQLVGVGFDAEVLQKRQRTGGSARGSSGLLGYARAGAKAFAGGYFGRTRAYSVGLHDGKYAYRGPRVNAEYSFDRLERTTRAPMIEIGTRPYYGKLFKVCPDVVCNDGNLDVYVFDIRRRRAVALNMSVLWRGKHEVVNHRLIARRQGMIERYEVKQVDVTAEEPFEYHVDGELLRAEDARLSVAVAPRALRFLVPERFYRLFHPFEYDATFQ
jgi:diacylglycerol kinase family enzyme